MEELERNAIEMLELICGHSGCIIADSGGKDSSIIKHIAMKAHEKYGLDFSIRHNLTTVDAPETNKFILQEKKRWIAAGINYEISHPEKSMWRLIVEKRAPPTRLIRYCCAELKERSGEIGERIVTGVRKAESRNRKENQGAITIPKPKEKFKTEVENNINFRSTVRGGGCSKS